MAGWRFWRASSSRDQFGPDAEPPSIDDATAEGVAMARQAAIMAVKNRILVSAHTSPEEFDVAEFAGIASEILESLARESDDAAERSREDRRAAATLKGRGIHQHDYRRQDVGNLVLREQSFEAVASQLRDIAARESELRELVLHARDQAWSELAREMERSLDTTVLLEHGDDRYAEEREDRLRDFLAIDLFRLQLTAQRTNGDELVDADRGDEY